jgi:hypothetical protein
MLNVLKIFALCVFAIGLVAGFYLIPSDQVSSEPGDSPLFAASLDNTTDRISGKGEPSQQVAGGGLTPLVTCEVTCGPTCDQTTCGLTCAQTCEFTCTNTCNQATCDATCVATCVETCANTCEQPTCETTCVVTCDYTCEEPITLASFGADAVGDEIVVSWTTGSEVDNYRFIVWRSTNPDNGFVAIEDVLSTGNGVSTTSYACVDANVQAGITYYYKLSDVSIYGYETLHPTVVSAMVALTDNFQLAGNFPNPFNPTTTIRFSLPVAAQTELAVFDMNGRKVSTLVNGMMSANTMHEIVWNATDNAGNILPSGMYIYRLTSGELNASGKMIFMK